MKDDKINQPVTKIMYGLTLQQRNVLLDFMEKTPHDPYAYNFRQLEMMVNMLRGALPITTTSINENKKE